MAISKQIQAFYDANQFMDACSMDLVEVEGGKCVMRMKIEPKHTNVYKFAHGGVLATLMDTAIGFAAAGLGCKVVTMNLNSSFLHSITLGEEATAYASTLHAGHHSIVGECEVRNQDGVLVAKSTGTMFVVGRITPDDAV